MPAKPSIRSALAKVERLLPGKPTHPADRRWLAMLHIHDEFMKTHPEEIWPFILRWGKHPQTDLRDAIACCLLEHLLENHFNLMFARVREAAKNSPRFADTLRRCYWMGEAAWAPNAAILDRIVGVKRFRFRPRRPKALRTLK
jgi:hypothetical protein